MLRSQTASEGFPVFVPSVAISPDGGYALSGGTDGTVRLWDISSGTELKRLQAHTGSGGTFYVAFSRDGKYFLSGGADGLLKLWIPLPLKKLKHSGLFLATHSVWLQVLLAMQHLRLMERALFQDQLMLQSGFGTLQRVKKGL